MELRWVVLLAALCLIPTCSSQQSGFDETPEAPLRYLRTSSSARALGLQNQLPRTASPSTYNIDLKVNVPQDDTFTGTVRIVLFATHALSYLTLHVNHDVLTINSAKISVGDGDNPAFTLSLTNDTELQTLQITLDKSMDVGTRYKLTLEYSGQLRNDMYGLYRSSYMTGTTTSVLAATQFEPTHARSAFPCWDEPEYKAKFTVSITHSNTLTARSNTVGTPTTTGVASGYTRTDFAETKLMSSYLLAFLVSDFKEQKSTNTDATQFSVWVRPDQVAQAAFAADIGARTLSQLETYVGIKFNTMLSKLDLAAIPDFSAGAMENWGLITFRETALMLKEGDATESARESIALVVAHEEAHMWFGDLVSPAWWSFTWLNEGFARYFQYVSTDLAEPTWRIMDTYIVVTKMSALEVDALQSSHPMSASVYTPTEVRAVFDQISYDKGSSILHMTRSVMGEANFKSALNSYLNEMQYTVATPRDLFRNFDKYSSSTGLPTGVTLTTVLSTWTEQAGYPLINVQVSADGATANITQSRYFSSATSAATSSSSTKWWVPLTYTQQSSINFGSTAVTWLNPSNDAQQIQIDKTGWAIFNLQHKGFYRVNYDSATWKKITDYLKVEANLKNIHLLNRAQLVDDALTLAKSQTLDYTTALDLTQYLANEVDPIPWRAAFNQLDYISSSLAGNTAAQTNYGKYVLSLLQKVYNQIGFVEKASDDHATKTFRASLLSHACDLGLKDCVDQAAAAFKSLRNSNTAVSVNARSAVYCSALRSGTTEDWDFLWNLYTKSDSANERVLILGALGCTKDTPKLVEYLTKTLSPSTAGVRAQDAQTVFSSVLRGNPENYVVAYDFVRNNIDKMVASPSFHTWSAMQRVVQGIANKIPTQAALQEYETFLKTRTQSLGQLVASSEVDAALESARSNLAWRTAHQDTVSRWLARAVGGANSAAPGSATVWWPALLLTALVSWISTSAN